MKLHIDTKAMDAAVDVSSDPFTLVPKPVASNGKSSSPPLEMSLTIHFNGEQEIDIPGAKALGLPTGKATFGIRRCKLHFTLVGCRLPLDEVALSAPFKRSVTIETQRERATETQIGATLGGTLGEKPSSTGSGTVGFKGAGKTVEKVTTERFQIHWTGDEDCPAWIFEVRDGTPILQGSLTREKLGTVYIEIEAEVKCGEIEVGQLNTESDHAIEPTRLPLVAVLSARAEDVRLTWGKYGWTPNITRNRMAVIERAIALKHIGSQLTDYLSKIEWHYVQH